MKLTGKYFIFTPLSDASDAPLVSVKTFREALYWHLPLRVGTWGEVFLQGLFICLCFLTHHKLALHSRRYNTGMQRNYNPHVPTCYARATAKLLGKTNNRRGATSSPLTETIYCDRTDGKREFRLERFSLISILKQWGFGGNLFPQLQPAPSLWKSLFCSLTFNSL